jgi:hypothetical protein
MRACTSGGVEKQKTLHSTTVQKINHLEEEAEAESD